MSDLTLSLPRPVAFIIHRLLEAGYDAYVVGGAVRDLMLRAQPDTWYVSDQVKYLTFDFDFTTNAKPEEITALFPESFYDNQFGTVGIAHKHILSELHVREPQSPQPPTETDRLINLTAATKIHPSLAPAIPADQTTVSEKPNYEITTYRSKERYDEDNRRPSSMEWGSSIQEDVTRRDFTINAMALTVPRSTLATFLAGDDWYLHLAPDQYQIIDAVDGMRDLDRDLIRTVGDPAQRFQEDALRMMRAVRFAVQLNFRIDDPTYQAIATNAQLLETISQERIRDELFKILRSDYPAEGIELLDELGMLQFILPEVQEGKGVEQGGHHTTDVWTHSIEALRECPSKDPLVRLATLLHDVAKPRTFERRNETITFYNHEVVGAHVAKEIGQRLKLSRDQINRLFLLVRYHMFYYQPENTDASIRRFMRNVGLENLDDILDLREADRLGSGARRTSWRLEEMKERMVEQLHQPMTAHDLAINGHVLMEKLQVKPGPILGEILDHLLEQVLEDPALNQEAELLKKAQEYLESKG